MLFLLNAALAVSIQDKSVTYTIDQDFDQGTRVNLNHETIHDQLQLNEEPIPNDFLWVAASARGTIIKIDTKTGRILGEYLSAPKGRYSDPSRTTVDMNGNVWSGNRDENASHESSKGSMVQIGLEENGQCVDRNGNGNIDTSIGFNDIKKWSNKNGADDNGGVSTAEDECIIKYLRTNATAVRTLAIDANNNIWIGGRGNFIHELYDGNTGEFIPNSKFANECGGYGGLIDKNGILWSSGAQSACLLGYDPVTRKSMTIPMNFSYGLARDNSGNIWNSQFYYSVVSKISPEGKLIGTYKTGGKYSRGVAVTSDDDIWVANSVSNTVTRLYNNGTLKARIKVGMLPTGVAVDNNNKVWVTNFLSNNVSRIDPKTDAIDLSVDLGKGAGPYDYSDMIGRYLFAPSRIGTWTVVYDSGIPDAKWEKISWDADLIGNSKLKVTAASSDDGTNFGSFVKVANGDELKIGTGRYLKVAVVFERASRPKIFRPRLGDSPVLYDLTIVRSGSQISWQI